MFIRAAAVERVAASFARKNVTLKRLSDINSWVQRNGLAKNQISRSSF
jgi:hypothetical protein